MIYNNLSNRNDESNVDFLEKMETLWMETSGDYSNAPVMVYKNILVNSQETLEIVLTCHRDHFEQAKANVLKEFFDNDPDLASVKEYQLTQDIMMALYVGQ